MKEIESRQVIQDIVESTTTRFRTFGGGQTTPGNVLAEVYEDKEAIFALGVSINEVVFHVVSETLDIIYNMMRKENKNG